MLMLKITPIRAAKIFGPALTGFCFKFKIRTIRFDKNAKKLYWANPDARSMKSVNRTNINTSFEVRKNANNNNTVKAAFKRTKLLSVRLYEIGQTAFVFIIECF